MKYVTLLIELLRNDGNSVKKTDFGAHFERFLVYALLRSMSYAPIPFEMKGLIEIHNRVKFHHYTISGYQVINFQRFL